jgi:hypothetical protein
VRIFIFAVFFFGAGRARFFFDRYDHGDEGLEGWVWTWDVWVRGFRLHMTNWLLVLELLDLSCL